MDSVAAARLSRDLEKTQRRTPQATTPATAGLAHDSVLHLQRIVGNQAVTRLMQAGESLEPATRSAMEARFGHDFSSVQIRNDQFAVTLARRLGADAFTVGDQVFLGATVSPLHTPQGRHALAHELAHVVQQRRGGGLPTPDPQSPSEQEADAAGTAVAGGGTPALISQARRSGSPSSRPIRGTLAGYAGEQGMGFELYPQSEGWIFFEGPSGSAGHQVTDPGFDGVAYNTQTGELHLIDNKSFKSTRNVREATAIDPSVNLPTNVDDLIARIEAAQDVPGRIRMLASLRRTKAALAAGKSLPADVKLVVTSVGGRSTDVTPRLKAQGVEHRPPRPASPPAVSPQAAHPAAPRTTAQTTTPSQPGPP